MAIRSRRSVLYTGLAGLSLVLALAAYVWLPSEQEPAYTMVNSWGGRGTEAGQFSDPNGIAVTDDRVFVADSRNHRIQVFTHAGQFVAQWPVPDEGRPMNLDVANGQLYAADYWNDRIRIYETASGDLVRSLGQAGEGPGELNSPGGVAVGPGGHVFVADFFNQRVQELTADGQFVRQWGRTGEKGYFFAGGFNYPIDVDVADDGTLFVADGFNDRIQVFGPEGEFLHKWGGPFAANIRGSWHGWFKVPTSVALGSDEAVFVADQENNRVQKFTRGGDFLTAFGTPHEGEGYTESAVDIAPDGKLFTVNLIHNEVEVWQPVTEPEG